MELEYNNSTLQELVNQTDIEELRETFSQPKFRKAAKDILSIKGGHRKSVKAFFDKSSNEEIAKLFNWQVTNTSDAITKAVLLTSYFEWCEKHPEWDGHRKKK